MEYDAWFEACYMQVYSYVMTLTRDGSLAEEITQETFFKAMSAQGKARFREESRELTWLCAIAKNLFLDETRRRKKRGEMPEELPAGGDLASDAADRDTTARIHVILHAMEEPYKEVFQLRVFGELPFRQIGALFGKTENWARVTYHRAKLKIQERMKDVDTGM